MSVNMGQAVGYLDLDTSKFKKGLRSALGDLKTFQSETATSKDKLSSLSSAASTAGKSLTKSLTLPLTGLVAASVKVTSTFDAGMSKVQAISGATAEELELLRDKAKQMGAQTKFSATESTEAFNYMAMAGWKAEDMLNGIEGIMNLAAASGEDLATTSDIVTDALTAFGLSAEDSSHFADVLAMASSNANTNVAMMGETFKYVGPVAGALGFSVEDVSVAIGLMANSGIKGSQAGTALRNLFTRMAKPTKESAAAMKALGVSLTDSEGNMKDFNTIMLELREGFSGLTQAQKAQYASALAGQYGMSGLLAVVNSSDADFNKLTEAINNADGASAEMAEVMMDNLPGALTLARSALEGLGIRIGEVVTPTITKVVQKFTEFIAWLSQASDGAVKFAIALATVLASIGPILLVLGTMTRQVLTLVEAYEKLNAVLAGKSVVAFIKSAAAKVADTVSTIANTAANTANRLSISGMASSVRTATTRVLALASAHKVAAVAALGVVGVIGGLIAYMVKTGTSAEEMKAKVVDMFNNLVKKLPEIWNTVTEVAVGIVQKIPSMISSALSSMGQAVTKGLTTLKEAIPDIAKWWKDEMPQLIAVGADMVVNVIEGFAETMPELIETGSNMLVQLIDQFFAEAPAMIDAGVQMVLSMIQGFVETLPQLVETVSKFLRENIGPIVNAVSNMLKTIGNALIKNIPVILESVTKIVTSILKAIAENAPTIIKAALKIVLALAEGLLKALPQLLIAVGKITIALLKALLSIVGAVVEAGVEILKALWRGIQSWASALYGKVKEVGKSVLKKIVEGLGNLFQKGLDWVKGLWNGVKSWTSSLFSNAKNTGKTAYSNVVSGIGNLYSSGKEWIVSLWNGISSWAGTLKQNILNFILEIPKKVKGGLGSLYYIGIDFIQGLWNGIKDKISSMLGWVKEKAENIVTTIKDAFKIGSPSKVMYQIGEWFMEGWQNGMEKGFKPIVGVLQSQLDDVLSVYNPLKTYDFGVSESVDEKVLKALNGLSAEGTEGMGNHIEIVNNMTVDGAENPEDFAERFARQLKIDMRTV